MALTFDIRKAIDHHSSANRLLDLKHLADLTLSVTTRLEVTLDTTIIILGILRGLKVESETYVSQELRAHEVKLKGYISSAKLLYNRITGCVSSVGATLSFFESHRTHTTSSFQLASSFRIKWAQWKQMTLCCISPKILLEIMLPCKWSHL